MQAYDLIMLIVVGMATIFGAIKGFAWQVASLASIVVSYIVAYRFRFDVAEMIQAKPPWNQFLAMLILYVGTSFVIWVGFRLLSSSIDRVRLKEFDRHLGAAFGLAKGLVYCLLITMFATSLLGPNQQAAICQSRSGYYIAKALHNGMGILPKEIHDVVGPYLARLDNKLKEGGAGQMPSGDEGSFWPTGGIPGLDQGLSQMPQDFQDHLRDQIREALPAVPGMQSGTDSGFPNFENLLPPASQQEQWNSRGSNPQFPTNSFPSSVNGSNQFNSAPQVYPPLSQPSGRPSGLRPVSPQQAQQPGALLPR